VYTAPSMRPYPPVSGEHVGAPHLGGRHQESGDEARGRDAAICAVCTTGLDKGVSPVLPYAGHGRLVAGAPLGYDTRPTMLPTAVLLQNFRSFAGPAFTKLELRPITLLFGRNGGGKSALVRSLPLLADSLGSDRLDALDVESRLKSFKLDFDSLRWKGRAETDEHTIGLGLCWDSDPDVEEVTWAIRENDEWRRLVVDRFAIHGPAAVPLLVADWRLTHGEKTQRALTYDVRLGDAPAKRMPIGFDGLLPDAGSIASFAPLVTLDARLKQLATSVLWLHSLRPAPERFTRWQGAVRWSLDPDGRDAPVVLAGEPELLKDVSSWYEKHLDMQLIVEESRKREVRTLVRNRSRARFDVDLIDTGEGLSECLSVLTALAMARRHEEHGGPSILAIEEPGSHLHPDLQRALAQRICEVAKDSRSRIILETHSEYVLRTVELNVVNKTLRPEDVIIYWVNQLPDGRSIVERVELDASGRLRGNWPPGAFQQDIELAADIQDERDRRERS
jgi:predicted ATPase